MHSVIAVLLGEASVEKAAFHWVVLRQMWKHRWPQQIDVDVVY
tara:strand:- start:706 stop:834 length:129 start_codon:yes stop_codon:yes gene_type:complete